MKPLTCEMCGSTEVLKVDGVFVCQSCKTKYTVEEAKALMIKIDKSADINRLLLSADNYLNMRDYTHAGELYTKVTEIDPNNWRGVFFSVYCASANCKIGQIPHYLDILKNSTKTIPPMIVMELVDVEKFRPALLEYFTYLFQINYLLVSNLRTMFIQHSSKESRERYEYNAGVAYSVQLSLAENWLTNPVTKGSFNVPSFKEPLIKIVMKIYEQMFVRFDDLMVFKLVTDDSKDSWEEILKTYNELLFTTTLEPYILEYYPNYENTIVTNINEIIARFEENKKSNDNKQSTASGGCYVATCVYGSYDCPEVWTLRRYRDYSLKQTWYGRAFIVSYYAVSPTLVKWFGKNQWFIRMWRGNLDKIVEKLQKKGFENTPYHD